MRSSLHFCKKKQNPLRQKRHHYSLSCSSCSFSSSDNSEEEEEEEGVERSLSVLVESHRFRCGYEPYGDSLEWSSDVSYGFEQSKSRRKPGSNGLTGHLARFGSDRESDMNFPAPHDPGVPPYPGDRVYPTNAVNRNPRASNW
eukprot:TCALIF_03711-PA protein Name:"Protein of unknown function" AED:0.58 eAED:0.58 QI:0/0/0/0.25/1/0.75/4/0/142